MIIITYGNKYSHGGKVMKTIIQKNQHIVFLTALVCCIIGVVYVTDEKVEKEQVTIQQGDTLWTLSELYRGKMSAEKWIAQVKEVNHLRSEQIIVGEQLIIPVEQNSYYVATKNIQQDEQKTEVASDVK